MHKTIPFISASSSITFTNKQNYCHSTKRQEKNPETQTNTLVNNRESKS